MKKKKAQQFNDMKPQFFAMVNKTDELLSELKKTTNKIQINKIREELEDTIKDTYET